MDSVAVEHLLIVEDHPLQRHIFKRLLVDAGFHVEIADGETQAIQMATHHQPDVVVLDLYMDPEGIWRRLKTVCGNAALVVTGHFTTESMSRRMGAAAFVADKDYGGVVDAVHAVVRARTGSLPNGKRARCKPAVSDAELLKRAASDAISHMREAKERPREAFPHG